MRRRPPQNNRDTTAPAPSHGHDLVRGKVRQSFDERLVCGSCYNTRGDGQTAPAHRPRPRPIGLRDRSLPEDATRSPRDRVAGCLQNQVAPFGRALLSCCQSVRLSSGIAECGGGDARIDDRYRGRAALQPGETSPSSCPRQKPTEIAVRRLAQEHFSPQTPAGGVGADSTAVASSKIAAALAATWADRTARRIDKPRPRCRKSVNLESQTLVLNCQMADQPFHFGAMRLRRNDNNIDPVGRQTCS